MTTWTRRVGLSASLLLLSFAAWIGGTLAASPPVDLVRLTVTECEHRIAHNHSLESAAIGAAIYWELPMPDLIVRIIERRENKQWNPEAESVAGAVGLAQVKPGTACRYTPGCYPEDKPRLGRLALALRKPHFNLCWSGKILNRLVAACGMGGLGCAVASYYAGEVSAIYAADILRP